MSASLARKYRDSALTEHVVVTIPANTAIYVVPREDCKPREASEEPQLAFESTNSASTDQLRQLLQLAARTAANDSNQRAEISRRSSHCSPTSQKPV